MTVTVTRPIDGPIALHPLDSLPTAFGVVIIVLVLLLLLVKELIRQYGPQWRAAAPAIDAVVGPLILATIYVVVVRMLDIANLI